MATILKHYRPKKRGAPAKYPWSEWFDGERRRLKPVRDFSCQPRSMANYIRDKARSIKFGCSVYVEGEAIVIDPH
jgi:hypothetical protein